MTLTYSELNCVCSLFLLRLGTFCLSNKCSLSLVQILPCKEIQVYFLYLHYYRDSSVGRASDWRSEGPWFKPGELASWVLTGVHQGEPLFPLIPRVNPFPGTVKKIAHSSFLSRLWGLHSRGSISLCRFSPFSAVSGGLLTGEILFFTLAIRRCAIFTGSTRHRSNVSELSSDESSNLSSLSPT